MYEDMFSGVKIEFNLLENNKKTGKVNFVFNKNYTVKTNDKFIRSI